MTTTTTTTTEHTEPETLDDALATIDAVADYGWAGDGAGSIEVVMAADAGGWIIHLHQTAKRFGYRPVLESGDIGEQTTWRLEVNC